MHVWSENRDSSMAGSLYDSKTIYGQDYDYENDSDDADTIYTTMG